jgi:cytoskeletal protein CcmA (bactofilin family)
MARFGKGSSPQPPSQPGKPASTVTVVAKETRLVGELTGSRGARIEGSFKGTVDLKAPLEVVEGAEVEAEVRATSVRIAGTVIGNVTATDLVELLASAVIKGDVTAPSLHMMEGARLEGRVQMRLEDRAVPRPGAAQIAAEPE